MGFTINFLSLFIFIYFIIRRGGPVKQLLSRVYTGPAFGSSGGIIPSRVRTITGRARIERLHTHVKLFAVPSAIRLILVVSSCNL